MTIIIESLNHYATARPTFICQSSNILVTIADYQCRYTTSIFHSDDVFQLFQPFDFNFRRHNMKFVVPDCLFNLVHTLAVYSYFPFFPGYQSGCYFPCDCPSFTASWSDDSFICSYSKRESNGWQFIILYFILSCNLVSVLATFRVPLGFIYSVLTVLITNPVYITTVCSCISTTFNTPIVPPSIAVS
jgi:hypothetical protein